ncbi:MAG: hypothetical protein M0Q15_04230 [Nevskia sp.]|jgi:hypothetical protein|nr:hypothetical protein [Nevskia sp.]
MKVATKLNSIALAAAAATMFLAAPTIASASEGAAGHCVGANSCKGTSACKTANSACKGQNACKGQGFLEKTKAECDKLGGKFEAAAK